MKILFLIWIIIGIANTKETLENKNHFNLTEISVEPGTGFGDIPFGAKKKEVLKILNEKGLEYEVAGWGNIFLKTLVTNDCVASKQAWSETIFSFDEDMFNKFTFRLPEQSKDYKVECDGNSMIRFFKNRYGEPVLTSYFKMRDMNKLPPNTRKQIAFWKGKKFEASVYLIYRVNGIYHIEASVYKIDERLTESQG